MKIERYEIEFATPGAPSLGASELKSIADVEGQLERLPDPPYFLLVAALGGNVDFGNFLLWTNGVRAIAKLYEHRDFSAEEREKTGNGDSSVLFCDNDGEGFVEISENTITHESAMNAMRHWMQTMEQTPDLKWA